MLRTFIQPRPPPAQHTANVHCLALLNFNFNRLTKRFYHVCYQMRIALMTMMLVMTLTLWRTSPKPNLRMPSKQLCRRLNVPLTFALSSLAMKHTGYATLARTLVNLRVSMSFEEVSLHSAHTSVIKKTTFNSTRLTAKQQGLLCTLMPF
ncbi:uncharacterized protein EDB93DRAFT_879531 [Suillus bovinus]|uniref:uncharacterized protein n=1 Tax=Suillus bovinus TaxID=48563 RepID=UPI001B8617F9|nr:uncharacterized protein EDB93DRAFT_879531 [Suillus bovinus]KAG2133576.1 hypothetical protein EDB93DRAFT_879531 [Suillus bovinus]